MVLNGWNINSSVILLQLNTWLFRVSIMLLGQCLKSNMSKIWKFLKRESAYDQWMNFVYMWFYWHNKEQRHLGLHVKALLLMMFERFLNTFLKDMFYHIWSISSWFHKFSNFRICKYLNPAIIYLLKVSKKIIRKMCEICSKLTINAPEPR